MDALTEICFKTLEAHGEFLCINVYSPDTQKLNTQCWLMRLYGLEMTLKSGRFQNHLDHPLDNRVTIHRRIGDLPNALTAQRPLKVGTQGWFSRCVEWIAEETSKPWHFDVRATMEFADSEPDFWFGFSFTDADDAVLFKLKFS